MKSSQCILEVQDAFLFGIIKRMEVCSKNIRNVVLLVIELEML